MITAVTSRPMTDDDALITSAAATSKPYHVIAAAATAIATLPPPVERDPLTLHAVEFSADNWSNA